MTDSDHRQCILRDHLPPLISAEARASMFSKPEALDADLDIFTFAESGPADRRLMLLKWAVLAASSRAYAEWCAQEAKLVRSRKFSDMSSPPSGSRPADSLINARCDKDENWLAASNRAIQARAIAEVAETMRETFLRAVSAAPYEEPPATAPEAPTTT